jgi:lysophospholipase L1-like esterase
VVRFVALGDSLTEGVGDPHPACPNGLRGWADLLAARFALTDPDTEYANLALRAKRAVDVLREQVDVAVSMRPDVVTLWAGGNDILRPVLRYNEVLAPADEAVARLTATGAKTVVFTGFQLTGSPILGILRSRVIALNEGLRDIASSHGAALIDVSSPEEWAHRALWAPDRVHPSTLGHQRLAELVAQAVGMPLGSLPAKGLTSPVAGTEPSGIRERFADEREWWTDHVIPHVRRWVAGASAREGVAPKWSELVRPATEFAW